MRRSGAVPLGEYGRRVATFAAAGMLAAAAGGCTADEQQDAQPVCGYEDGGDFVVVDQAECDDDDRDRDRDGHSLVFMHFPTGTAYAPGTRHPSSGSAFSAKPSTVSRGYGAGTVKTGGFGSGGGGSAPKGGSGGG